jgi:hypothetical protein
MNAVRFQTLNCSFHLQVPLGNKVLSSRDTIAQLSHSIIDEPQKDCMKPTKRATPGDLFNFKLNQFKRDEADEDVGHSFSTGLLGEVGNTSLSANFLHFH